MPDLTGVPSTPAQQIAIALISTCGLLSGLVTGGLLVYLFWSAYGWHGRYSTSQNGFKSFLKTDAGRYLVSLLVADLCHAAAYTSGFHWLVEGRVDRGNACVRQAVFLQLGDMGTVLWIFILSAHTLVLLFLSRRPPLWFRPALLVLGWTVVILMPVLGPVIIARPDEPFYNGGSGLWCWVNDAYPKTQILYFFVWAIPASSDARGGTPEDSAHEFVGLGGPGRSPGRTRSGGCRWVGGNLRCARTRVRRKTDERGTCV